MNFITNAIYYIKLREELNNLTDRELRDIGLNRYDIDTYCKSTLKEDLTEMFKNFKNFFLNAVETWQDGLEMRDKILSKYKYVGD
jgi:hypothetical protein